MNKHVNKNRVPAPQAQNRKQIEVDGMPPQVALEMLCSTGRLTNRQRKTCWLARTKFFASTLEKKSRDLVLAAKLKASTWAQIARWNKRVESRGALLESAYAKALQERQMLATAEVDRNNPANTKVQARIIILDRLIAALELKRGYLMTFSDALRNERERRENFIASLRKLVPSVAESLEPKLIGAA